MKYKSIFDMSYLREEQKYPDTEKGNAEKFTRLLRTFGTDIVNPPLSELPEVSSEEINSLMMHTPRPSRKHFFSKVFLGGIAASLFIIASLIFIMDSFAPNDQQDADRKNDFLIMAFKHRNSEDMLKFADTMKSEQIKETTSAAIDRKTIISAAAYLALQQKNQKTLRMIAANYPETVKNINLNLTRGMAQNNQARLPELVKITKEDTVKLMPHQYPLWNAEIIKSVFTLSETEATRLAGQINSALYNMNSLELAQCSILLAQYKSDAGTCQYFTADALFSEAWNLAAAGGNISHLREILIMYKTSKLYNSKQFKILESELKYISQQKESKNPLESEYQKVKKYVETHK